MCKYCVNTRSENEKEVSSHSGSSCSGGGSCSGGSNKPDPRGHGFSVNSCFFPLNFRRQRSPRTATGFSVLEPLQVSRVIDARPAMTGLEAEIPRIEVGSISDL